MGALWGALTQKPLVDTPDPWSLTLQSPQPSVAGRGSPLPTPSNLPVLVPWGHPPPTLGYLVGGEGADVGQQGLPELWALVKDGTQLLGRQLQDDLEALGLGALTALDKALPHLGVLPHLDGAGRERA